MARLHRFAVRVLIFAIVICAAHFCFADEVWQTNFEAAKTKAKAEHKLLLVDFSGSDWCPWCKKMKTDVFDQENFKVEARKNYILVNLDYPNQKELPAEIARQNRELRKQYKVDVFPTICLMDPKGQLVSRSGYQSGGPADFLKNMNGFAKTNREIAALRKKLDRVGNLGRAKLLDQIVMDYEQNGVEDDQTAKYSAEIISLDPENKTGLKLKYEFRTLLADGKRLAGEKQVAEAQADFEKAAALPGIKGKGKQSAWFAEAECFFGATQFRRGVAELKKARAAAPDGPKVSDIDAALKQYSPMADAQQQVATLTSEADSSHGPQRAAALDRLVDAQLRFNQLVPAERNPQQIKKWSDEIIELDSDNSAGLKTKYRLRELLVQAGQDVKAGEKQKARTAINEARDLPGLSDDQKAKVREMAEKLGAR
jgi:thioredoxin-related protein